MEQTANVRSENGPPPAIGLGRQLGYGIGQASRVAWFAGHSALMRRIDARQGPGPKIEPPSVPVPPMGRLLSDVRAVLARDLENVKAGLYPLPQDDEADLVRRVATSRAFLSEIPILARRRREASHQEPFEEARGKRPRYYLQNFHFQSGGWMTEQSARLYDMQVETLFSGAASAMRRQALVPMAEHLRGRDQRRMRFADIACGTGAFLADATRAFPRLPSIAVDMSESYTRYTAERLADRARVRSLVANAEALPLPDGALDIATCIYLFHELPPKVRRVVAKEAARVVQSGGLFVLVDSLQTGDEPAYDGLLELFPRLFHEPYYAHYTGDDLVAVFHEAGFDHEESNTAFFSKVMRFRRR